MTTKEPDPLLWSARKERARRWLSTDLRGYPTLSAEEETEETLAAEPTECARDLSPALVQFCSEMVK